MKLIEVLDIVKILMLKRLDFKIDKLDQVILKLEEIWMSIALQNKLLFMRNLQKEKFKLSLNDLYLYIERLRYQLILLQKDQLRRLYKEILLQKYIKKDRLKKSQKFLYKKLLRYQLKRLQRNLFIQIELEKFQWNKLLKKELKE